MSINYQFKCFSEYYFSRKLPPPLSGTVRPMGTRNAKKITGFIP
ncbi:hypothetical protein CLOBOL_01984 [Enterocloster bolteae ATCC BAA-613]|uniref:Uncharacterized protein n=1 Tax=Enterocloster bolteae (strain ATCC BAA-613 / DSM 15670 / CCUG 46953 / JCM 12243 / WAL 16351) TaxID=411902 RepID=A8RMQ1_ENTBW|nr:hypothetical protein CLOBOL_01984 [Enterocloster bolteae ATCC BAA-613]